MSNQIVKNFVNQVSHKPFYKAFQKIWDGEDIGEIDVAKALSSYITSCLIELEKDNDSYSELLLPQSATFLRDFINGEVGSAEVVKKFIYINLRILIITDG